MSPAAINAIADLIHGDFVLAAADLDPRELVLNLPGTPPSAN